MKKSLLFTLTLLIIFVMAKNTTHAQNLMSLRANNHICKDKKYDLCCTDKKALFKSFHCRNYKCPPKHLDIIPGIYKPAVYLYSPGTALGAKPAVYLYTKSPIKVNITLDKSVLITYDAPKYIPGKGWNVLVYPDGRIKDLQPQFTDCNKYNDKKFGLEYAKSACTANNYPYIFWEGKMTKIPVPVSKTGWIVEQKNLQSFFNSKLDYIGFNKSEKDEFIRYWVKRLSTGNNSYFIYFLQTKAVNNLAPMQVYPKPDSINRIYMVAKPVSKTTLQRPHPQNLEKFKRKGFTLVEWGGTVLN